MNKSDYSGLYLAVFDRHNMKLVYSGIYDTFTYKKPVIR